MCKRKSLTRYCELSIAGQKFKLSVHIQLLIFYQTVFKQENNQDEQNKL